MTVQQSKTKNGVPQHGFKTDHGCYVEKRCKNGYEFARMDVALFSHLLVCNTDYYEGSRAYGELANSESVNLIAGFPSALETEKEKNNEVFKAALA